MEVCPHCAADNPPVAHGTRTRCYKCWGSMDGKPKPNRHVPTASAKQKQITSMMATGSGRYRKPLAG